MWAKHIEDMKSNKDSCYGVPLMEEVLENLTTGCDSGVIFPGSSAIKSKNYFPDPLIDIPRMADALASEVKANHMAGPFHPGYIHDAKIYHGSQGTVFK